MDSIVEFATVAFTSFCVGFTVTMIAYHVAQWLADR